MLIRIDYANLYFWKTQMEPLMENEKDLIVRQEWMVEHRWYEAGGVFCEKMSKTVILRR